MRIPRHLLLLAGLLLLVGCTAVPMNYQEWQDEQERRRTAEASGIEFKSNRQLLVEGEELKRIAGEVRFP